MTLSSERLWGRARRYIATNQAEAARAMLESILARDPGDVSAHLILAGLYMADGRQRSAMRHAVLAARNPPEDLHLLGGMISALLNVGAVVEAKRLLSLPTIACSTSVTLLMRAASQLQILGDHVAALRLIEKSRAAGASGREFHFQRAVQLAFNGLQEESISELEHCISMDPPLGRAYVQLMRIQEPAVRGRYLSKVNAALKHVSSGSEDEAALCFARYEILESLQRYDEAWRALLHGNEIMFERLIHAARDDDAKFEYLINLCTSEFLSDSSAKDGGEVQPIFILGMPRSGTTVLERMLGNHSQVTSAGELGDFPRALAYATDHLAPVMFDRTTLDRLHSVNWKEVGSFYLSQTRWRAKSKRFFVDKLPRNWMLAGLIHKALPSAKILHLVRNPMDVFFSNWRAYFGPGIEYAYAYNFESLKEHYRIYRRLMDHWHAALPGKIMDVDYSRLVTDPESVLKEIVAFCGLESETGCSDLTRNLEPSATLSMHQARRPIHAEASRKWERYSQQMESVRSNLAWTW